ncbi:MAPEG family protein [Alteromonas sp. 5E99-2]|uniref:MAPEG family protein n=1 Tax=Alteromonas sp. 5E99-2 TaxID=2817683 RepID=UPI001A98D714|nr:MAPEG family protein [Alteromonas sp. 5E99-2]MBO1255771.1 MAPEG family protein [Alteromonas sp. 5E99-2]
MTHTGLALLGFIIWTLTLLVAMAVYRTALVQTKKKATLKFASDGSDIQGFGERLTRAQANCSESFVFIGGTLLYSLATNNMVITDSLALILLAARVGQSLVHLVSTSDIAIQGRFVLFLTQIGIVSFWIYRFFLV